MAEEVTDQGYRSGLKAGTRARGKKVLDKGYIDGLRTKLAGGYATKPTSGSQRRWIQRAIKRPGDLTKWAKEHGLVSKTGRIEIPKAMKVARREGSPLRDRQVNLARTLGGMRAHIHSRAHKHPGRCDKDCRAARRAHQER